MKTRLKYVFIVLVFASLILFIGMTDMSQVLLQIKSLGFNLIYILLISLAGYLTGAYAWKLCFADPKIGFLKLAYTRTIGELIALFNPTNILAGEAFKIYYLRNTRSTADEILDSVLLSRLVMIISQILLAMICIIILIERSGSSQLYLYLLAALLVPVMIILVIKKFFSRTKENNELIANKFIRSIHKYYSLLIQSTQRIWKEVRSKPVKIMNAFFWTSVHWLLGALEIYVILELLSIHIFPINAIIMDMGVVGIKSIAGFIPGQFGVEELSNKLLLELIGINVVGLWLTVSIVRRAKQLFWIAAGMLSYFAINLKTKNYGNTVYNT